MKKKSIFFLLPGVLPILGGLNFLKNLTVSFCWLLMFSNFRNTVFTFLSSPWFFIMKSLLSVCHKPILLIFWNWTHKNIPDQSKVLILKIKSCKSIHPNVQSTWCHADEQLFTQTAFYLVTGLRRKRTAVTWTAYYLHLLRAYLHAALNIYEYYSTVKI